MGKFIDRFDVIYREYQDDLPSLIRKAEDPVYDNTGACADLLESSLRLLGVGEYVLKGNIEGFKTNLSKAAEIQLKLFQRFDAGEPIAPSLVTMLSHKAVLNALAARNFSMAKDLSLAMGGRDGIEKQHDHMFDYVLGYALKAFVLHHRDQMEAWATRFKDITLKANLVDFQGYAVVFGGILASSAEIISEGLEMVIKGHERQSKGKGIFRGTEDETLSVWGIGVANLASMHGLRAKAIPPLIPGNLLG